MASLWEIISSKNKSTNYNGKGLQIWLYFKKPSYSSKDTINKVKHQTTTQGNLFVIHITTKVLCPEYDEKKPHQSIKKKTKEEKIRKVSRDFDQATERWKVQGRSMFRKLINLPGKQEQVKQNHNKMSLNTHQFANI